MVFKTDAALSRVLPNPWSPAGYFPSEAIYLFTFRCWASVSHLWFYLSRGKELSLPNPPKSLVLGMGSEPILGRRGSSGAGTRERGARALLISFPSCFREVCSKLQLLVRVFQLDEAALWAGGIPEGSGLGFESFLPAGN